MFHQWFHQELAKLGISTHFDWLQKPETPWYIACSSLLFNLMKTQLFVCEFALKLFFFHIIQKCFQQPHIDFSGLRQLKVSSRQLPNKQGTVFRSCLLVSARRDCSLETDGVPSCRTVNTSQTAPSLLCSFHILRPAFIQQTRRWAKKSRRALRWVVCRVNALLFSVLVWIVKPVR